MVAGVPVASSPCRKPGTAKTLLLVEDDFIINFATMRKLQSWGYAVLTAPSGERGVELFRGNRAIELVLMDMDLGPGRMSGIEAAAAMATMREVPILFLTACSRRHIEERISGLSRWGYVPKASPEQLLYQGILRMLETDTVSSGGLYA